MSDDYELIEDLIGSEGAFKIAEAFAGSAIYIPQNILKNKKYHDIRKKYNAGSTYRRLSVEYGYTETHIRRIIHGKKPKAGAGTTAHQKRLKSSSDKTFAGGSRPGQ